MYPRSPSAPGGRPGYAGRPAPAGDRPGTGGRPGHGGYPGGFSGGPGGRGGRYDYNTQHSIVSSDGFRSTKTVFNTILLLATLAAGVIMWFVGEWLYGELVFAMPRPVLIGLLFLLLYVLVIGAILLVGAIRHTFYGCVLFLDGTGPIAGLLAGGAAAIFLLAMLFQFLYGLQETRIVQDATSYIFVLDNSGSMESNDPNQLRYQAIDAILSDRSADFPYMVYGFADDTTLMRGMAPASQGNALDTSNLTNGMTYMFDALNQVLEDYQNGVWSDSGGSPRVILLTDGIASDISSTQELDGVLQEYYDAGISISTVGLGDGFNIDIGMLERIAGQTGGVFVHVTDINQLAGGMGSAALYSSSRDLVNYTYRDAGSIPRILMRVVFLFLLGGLLSFLALFAYGQEDNVAFFLIAGGVTALVGALFMEFSTSSGLSESIARLVLWLLLAATPALLEKIIIVRPNINLNQGTGQNPYNNGGGVPPYNNGGAPYNGNGGNPYGNGGNPYNGGGNPYGNGMGSAPRPPRR